MCERLPFKTLTRTCERHFHLILHHLKTDFELRDKNRGWQFPATGDWLTGLIARLVPESSILPKDGLFAFLWQQSWSLI